MMLSQLAAALLMLGVALSSSLQDTDVAQSLDGRAYPEIYKLCPDQSRCPKPQICLTRKRQNSTPDRCVLKTDKRCKSPFHCSAVPNAVDCYHEYCHVLVGTQTLHQECSAAKSLACKEPLRCSDRRDEDDRPLPSTCLKQDGAVCSGGNECLNGHCVGGKCNIAREGEACVNDEDCAGFLYCSSDKKCKKVKHLRQPCPERNSCRRDLKCFEGACHELSYGLPCKSASTCDDFRLLCRDGKCGYRRLAGQPCSSNPDCEGQCIDHVCQNTGHSGCSNNADCPNGKRCVKEICT